MERFTTHFQPPLQDDLPEDYFDRFGASASKWIDTYYHRLAERQKDEWLVEIAEAVVKAQTVEELRMVVTDLLCWIRDYVVTEVKV